MGHHDPSAGLKAGRRSALTSKVSKVVSFWVESQASLIAMIHSCCDYLCPAYPVAFVHLALLHLSCIVVCVREREFMVWGDSDDVAHTLRFTQVSRAAAQRWGRSEWIIMFTRVVDCDYLFKRRASTITTTMHSKRGFVVCVGRNVFGGEHAARREKERKKNIIIECSVGMAWEKNEEKRDWKISLKWQ